MSAKRSLVGLTAILAMGFGLDTEARAADQPGAAPADQLQEIVVTSQKRAEKLDKVPISVTAIDQATLNVQGVKDVSDVARLVPGLSLRASDELGDTNISIRGITSDTGAQTTGVYIDDIDARFAEVAWQFFSIAVVVGLFMMACAWWLSRQIRSARMWFRPTPIPRFSTSTMSRCCAVRRARCSAPGPKAARCAS